MDKVLFHQHVGHFSQADGTLPTHKPITEFELYAEKPLGRAFCNNTLNIDNLDADSFTKEFLKELKRKTIRPTRNPYLPEH
eukprot:10560435-Ditylum_brightwellii.AAC.1